MKRESINWEDPEGSYPDQKSLSRMFRKRWGKNKINRGRWNETLTHVKSVMYKERLRYLQV